MEERKLGKTEMDFNEARDKAELMAAYLCLKFSWMKSFRFKGDVGFRANRKKESLRKKEAAGEEISFGLNMILTYEDEEGNIRETDIVLKHKERPFYEIVFTALAKKPTTADLVKQWKDTWLILYSGGTPVNPKAILVTKLGEFPEQCFVKVNEQKVKRGRFRMAFGKWAKWSPAKQVNIFGEGIDKEFEKIRRNK